MSKDIWHTTDKNPEEDRLIVVKSKRTGEYLVGSEFEFILDNFTKWAYFDDLLALETELERTRKAFEWARHFLKEIRLRYLIEKDSPSRQNKWADTALNMYNLTESFFDDYDKTNETKGGDNEL